MLRESEGGRDESRSCSRIKSGSASLLLLTAEQLGSSRVFSEPRRPATKVMSDLDSHRGTRPPSYWDRR